MRGGRFHKALYASPYVPRRRELRKRSPTQRYELNCVLTYTLVLVNCRGYCRGPCSHGPNVSRIMNALPLEHSAESHLSLLFHCRQERSMFRCVTATGETQMAPVCCTMSVHAKDPQAVEITPENSTTAPISLSFLSLSYSSLPHGAVEVSTEK